MPSTYSSLLRLELMATGEKSATWGDITNTNLGTLLEKSIAGTASVNVTAGNVTLTALNGADDEARCVVIVVSGTPGVSRNVVAPSSSKTYCVVNGSNAAIVFKGAATTGVTLAAGDRAWVAWSGSDFVRIGIGADSPTFTGTTSVANLTASGTASFAGQALFAAGSVGAPSITIAGDNDSGLYSIGANRVGLATAGDRRVEWDATGNMGLGYTPNAWRSGANAFQSGVFLALWQQTNGASNLGFGIYEDGANTFKYTTTGDPVSLYSQISGRHIWYGAASGTAGNAATLASRMELNTTSDLLVGGRITAGSGAPLLSTATILAHVGSNQNVAMGSLAGATPKLVALTDVGALASLALVGSPIILSVDDSSTWARFDSTGLGIGRTPSYKMDVAGNARIGVAGSGSGGSMRYMRDSGVEGWSVGILASVGATSWSVYDLVSGAERLTVTAGAGAAAVIDASGGFTAASLTTAGAGSFGSLAVSGNTTIGDALGDTLTVANGAFKVFSDGRISGNKLHNTGTVTGTTDQFIASGTYTPTFTTGTNVTGVGADPWKWIRVGNVVHVTGLGSVTCTAGGAGSQYHVSVPIASNFTLTSDLTGLASSGTGVADTSHYIIADTTNDRATVSFTTSGITGARPQTVSFSYEIK